MEKDLNEAFLVQPLTLLQVTLAGGPLCGLQGPGLQTTLILIAPLCELGHLWQKPDCPRVFSHVLLIYTNLPVVLNLLWWNCEQNEDFIRKHKNGMATGRALEFWMAKAPILFKGHCSPNKKLRTCSLQSLDHKMARAMRQAAKE